MKRDKITKPTAAAKTVKIIGKRNVMALLKQHLKNRPDYIIITDLDNKSNEEIN